MRQHNEAVTDLSEVRAYRHTVARRLARLLATTRDAYAQGELSEGAFKAELDRLAELASQHRVTSEVRAAVDLWQ